MEIPVLRQLEQAAAALLLGGGLGLLYDLCRAPRRRLGFSVLWDLFFWGCVLTGLFLLAQAGADGPRLYSLLAASLGAGLYMVTLSPPVLRCLEALCALPGRGLRFLRRRTGKSRKKIADICKKHFPKAARWFKMDAGEEMPPPEPDAPRGGGTA